MKLKAYAKINLSLKILGKRPDGYHEIESVMQSVSLCDLITLEAIPAGRQLTTNSLQLTADSRNLAFQAAELFFRAVGREPSTVSGTRIHIEKNIPIAAGLAGGSADAAAVLYGLNQLQTEDQRLKTEDLIKLGAEIGSDVPFCLVGGNCTVRGRGELVTRNQKPETSIYILVVPKVEISTKWAYSSCDEKSSILNLKSQNDLEAVVIEKYPVIQEIKDKLLGLGGSFVQMSGSGPAVFGKVQDLSLGEKILSEVKKDFPQSYLVHSVEQGVEEVL